MSWLGGKSGVAAFFDLDGTLIGEPSLEQRFFAELRRGHAIPVRNYFLWLAEAIRLAPRGIGMMLQANKMYLRGLCTDRTGNQGSEHPDQEVWERAGMIPRLFPGGVNQVAWHARQGHSIVVVSGTLAPLAQEMALALVVRLAVRGIVASVAVCATRLEEKEGRWTGRIEGDAMFGQAKGKAVRQMAHQKGFDLARCYAYGNCMEDRWMLEAVGRPCAVNPTEQMEKLARRRDWAVLAWAGKNVAQTSPTDQRTEAVALGRRS
jgi:HAD superfamily hydrolase (TIGR01490 family)